MNADRNYIKSLLTNIDEMETELKELKNQKAAEEVKELTEIMEENRTLKTKKEYLNSEVHDLKTERDELKEENQQLHKDIDKIKKTMKKPATIGTPNILNLFEDMKEGKIIKFIKPTRNKKYTQFKDNPFLFQIENKGAIFCGELIGMFETTKTHAKYFHNAKAPRMIGGEIMYQFLHVNDDTFDCSLKIGTGKSKKVDSMLFRDVLKLNPCINIKKQQFESYGVYKYIYTENDGSKYILKEGIKEYI